MEVSQQEYDERCRMRWHGVALANARANWRDFEELNETLEIALRVFHRNPGLEDLNGKFHNPDYSLTNFLWQLQTGLEPDRSRLHPLLDFEEYWQKVFLRRGLIIYCSLILERIEAEKPEPHPELTLVEFEHNPAHKIGTCSRCGGEMVYNVPRLGPNGGFVHKASGKFECELVTA